MADTKRTTGRPFEEKLHVLHNLHGTIDRPDKTGRQIAPCKPAFSKMNNRVMFGKYEKEWGDWSERRKGMERKREIV